MSDNGSTEATELRIFGSPVATSFVSGSRAIDVPTASAQRSTLITDLRQKAAAENISDATVQLPLAMALFEAWLACANSISIKAETNSPHGFATAHDDDTLLRALKASVFLGDGATVALTIEALGEAVLGSTSEPPTRAQSTRARKIVNEAPPTTMPPILSSLHERHLGDDNGQACIERLMRLLPRSLHPAIVQACFASPTDGNRCVIDVEDPDRQKRTPCPACRGRPGSLQGNGTLPQCTCAPPTFLLLAAAAPLAGGSLDEGPQPRAAADGGFGKGTVTRGRAPVVAPANGKRREPLRSSSRGVNGGMNGGVNGGRKGGMNGGMNGGRNGGMNGVKNGTMNGVKNGTMNGGKNGTMNGGKNGATNGGKNGATNGGVKALDDTTSSSEGETEKREWRLRGGNMTALELHMRRCMPVEPPRWASALGALSTLRFLHITMHSAVNAVRCLPAATAALAKLPEFEGLRVDFCLKDMRTGGTGPGMLDTCITSKNTLELLSAISAMPRLSSLDLRDCFQFSGAPDSARRGGAGRGAAGRAAGRRSVTAGRARPGSAPGPEEVISQLTQLSALTHLTLHAAVSTGRWTGAFARAVKQLPALQELEVVATIRVQPIEDVAASDDAGEFMVELVAGPGMPALKRLDCSIRKRRYVGGSHIARMHERMRADNLELLDRLTGLSFGDADVPYPKEAVVSLAADLPALRTLNLNSASGYLRTYGNECLHWPPERVTDLTAASAVGETTDEGAARVPRTGVLAVLRALVEPTGQHALQRLDVGYNVEVQAHSAAEFAALLRRFVALEELAMCGLGLGVDGLKEVAGALAALPRLRSLDARENVDEEARAALPAVFSGLRQLTALQF